MRECASQPLGDYLEGDLGVPERAAVEAHLGRCGRCREELQGLRDTVALLRGLPAPTPPRDLAPLVMARIESERREGWLRGAFRGLDATRTGLLAAGLACFALVGLWPRGAGDPVPPRSAPAREPAIDVARNAAGGPIRRPSRPAVGPWPPAASHRVAAFSGGVAPLAGIAELPAGASMQRERELDRQLERLMGDPATFLARMGPDVRGERFARLAQHAARRGRAASVATRLNAVSHPLADDLAPRFLAAELAAELERGSQFR